MDEKLQKLREVMRAEGYDALVIRKSLPNLLSIRNK